MPKLIIKREPPQRFTWQAILFWGLGLLPLALLAGFLTGNLISHWQNSSLKAGQVPLLPLAPIIQPQSSPPSSSFTVPLPLTTEIPSATRLEKPIAAPDTFIKPAIPIPTTKSKPSRLIKQANTKDQQNNRSRPVQAPSLSNKSVKSPQTVSESPRPHRPVIHPNPARPVQPASKPPEATKNKQGGTNDYRLLEQSLGIPLQ